MMLLMSRPIGVARLWHRRDQSVARFRRWQQGRQRTATGHTQTGPKRLLASVGDLWIIRSGEDRYSSLSRANAVPALPAGHNALLEIHAEARRRCQRERRPLPHSGGPKVWLRRNVLTVESEHQRERGPIKTRVPQRLAEQQRVGDD